MSRTRVVIGRLLLACLMAAAIGFSTWSVAAPALTKVQRSLVSIGGLR